LFGKNKKKGLNWMEEEVKRMKKVIEEIQRKRAEIIDLGRQAAAGLLLPETIAGTPGDKLEELRRLTVIKNYLDYLAYLKQLENKIDQEVSKLQEEVEKMTNTVTESISLNIIEPHKNTIAQGTIVITWTTTGPIGKKLNVYLLKRGKQFHIISHGTPTDAGCLEWKIPKHIPGGTDYQIALFDPSTAIKVISEEFEIKPQ
jgi:hypothetical protein